MISCILLAAGRSARMGERNKLLLPVMGGSLVRRSAKEISKFPFQEVVFVTGHDADAVAEELQFFDGRLVYNPNFASGMHSSIREGILGLREPCDGVVVCLSDQPLLHVETIQALAREFQLQSGPRILFPVVEGRKGHPVLISNHFFSEILSEADGDYGCSYLFKRHPQALRPIAVSDAGVLEDIDTPEDFERYQVVQP